MSEYLFTPLSELVTPRNGRMAIVDHWWSIVEGKGAVFFKLNKDVVNPSPQCNTNKGIVERLIERRNIPGEKCVYVPVAFVDHRCDPY